MFKQKAVKNTKQCGQNALKKKCQDIFKTGYESFNNNAKIFPI